LAYALSELSLAGSRFVSQPLPKGAIRVLQRNRRGPRSVAGVEDLDDQLQVRILDDERRADADVRGIALQILHWDTEVPDELVDVKVSDGWLTLTGEVNYQYQSDAAYYDVATLQGVTGITNEIKVITP
jgi:osmotically-inducible protein OsmY